ncbi:MAG: hypothetical protein RL211_535 [Pseudomonadota bacterium]|jgi:IS5 family transposase
MSETKKRNTHLPEFKAKVGLEAVRGVKTVNQIAQEFGVHPAQVGQWKREIQAQAKMLFEGKRGLSDPAMEEALHDVPPYCEFAHLDPGMGRLPDESTILRFRHLLEENNLSIQIMAAINATLATKGLMLRTGTVVDATLIAAPSSTKNSTGERDPEMHQAKKGKQWHFGMKALQGLPA